MTHRNFFYVRPQDITRNYLILQKDEMHHLVHVHRKNVEDRFLAVDGLGTGYDCQIEELNKDFLRAKILKKHKNMGEPVFQLTLALSIPKKGKFDWVVEKGTEIGITKFIPLLTKRSVVNTIFGKPKRWQRIAIAAMKQSGRSYLPCIVSPQYFESVCENSLNYDLKLIAHENSLEQKLSDLIQINLKSGILVVGPEGGFTDEEVKKALSYGFSTLGLGPRRLRSETAALIGAALILDKMGELS